MNDIYDLSTLILIHTFENLSKPALLSLADAINVSFETGEFPFCLKRAIVIPLHKGEDLEDPANFRLISLLIIRSKVV